MPCSNAAKTRSPFKFGGVPQSGKPISAAIGPKFTISSGHVEDILLLNKFFPIVDTCLSCKDIAQQSCAMVPRWRFLATFLMSCVSSEPRAAGFRPASEIRMCRSMADIQSATAEIRRGKEEEVTTGHKYNGLLYSIGRP